MQAERLDEVALQGNFLFLLREEHALPFQFLYLGLDLSHRFFVHGGKVVLFAVYLLHDFGREPVADVQRADGVIEKIIRAVGFECMYHVFSP